MQFRASKVDDAYSRCSSISRHEVPGLNVAMYNAVPIDHLHSLRSIYDDLQALSLIDRCCCRVVDPGLEAVSGKV